MGKLLDAVKAKENISSAIDAALAAKDTADVKAACAHCTTGATYDVSTLELLHDKTSGRLGDLPEIAFIVKEALAEGYVVEKNDVVKGAGILQPIINPKAGAQPQQVSDDLVLRASVKMIELFCYADEYVQAETLMTRCTKHIRYHADKELKIRFNCTQAQIHEFKRRFTEAAQRFYEVSINDPSQAVDALKRSAICAILAEPTDARARIVGVIVNDDRAKTLDALLPVMNKIHQMRFLRAQDSEVIKRMIINDAQKSGSPSILDMALLTHNIKAVSQVFYNISITELATLVGVTADEALRVVAGMISAGKINGTIDQVEDLVTFHSSRDDESNRSDAKIANLCNTVSQLHESLKLKYPQLAAPVSAK